MIVDRSNFTEIVKQLSHTGNYGFDTETYGLHWNDRLFSIILYDGKRGYYFNFQNYPNLDSSWVLPRIYIQRLGDIFGNRDSLFYIHNAKYDLRRLALEEMRVKGTCHCTMAIGRVVKNTYRSYSLDNCAKRMGWFKDDKVGEWVKKNKPKDYSEVPFELMYRYAIHDAKLTYDLGTYQRDFINKNPTLKRTAHNERLLTKTCFDMEEVGVKIDPSYIRKAKIYEQKELEKNIREFERECIPEFNDGRTYLVAAFNHVGVPYPKTDKGNPCFDDFALSKMDTPLAERLQKIRKSSKYISTYYENFLKSEDGIIHADMRQSGTYTGRFSYMNPNLQNIPKEDTQASAQKPCQVRGCFIPRKGYCFVMIDYDQQEYRLMIDQAGEKQIIEQVNNGVDLHQATADVIGVDRKAAKTLNFGLLYGMGKDSLARSLDVTTPQAAQVKRKYFHKLPRIRMWQDKLKKFAISHKFADNWFGRRCHLESRGASYIIPNHIIQGGCADIVKIAMNEIHAYLWDKKSRMLIQVHDEILFEIHESELPIVHKLQYIMEGIYKPLNGLNLSCSVDHSWKSWAHKDKIEGHPSGIKESL